MKHVFSKTMVLGVVLGAAASSAMANDVQLANSSPNHPKPMEVNYALAFQNPGEPVVLVKQKPYKLKEKEIFNVSINPGKYKYAGIVLLDVDGHIPPSEFGKPEQCSMATDAQNAFGRLSLSYSGPSSEHGTLSCATYGGVIIE